MCVEAWFLATVGSDSSERQQQGLRGLFKGHLISNKHKRLLFWSTPGKGHKEHRCHMQWRVQPTSRVSAASALSLSPQVGAMAEMGIMVA